MTFQQINKIKYNSNNWDETNSVAERKDKLLLVQSFIFAQNDLINSNLNADSSGFEKSCKWNWVNIVILAFFQIELKWIQKFKNRCRFLLHLSNHLKVKEKWISVYFLIYSSPDIHLYQEMKNKIGISCKKTFS